MTSFTLTDTQTLSTLSCSECGVLFALTDRFIKARRTDRATWYCPNGHTQWYPGKTETQRANEAEAQLEAAKRTAKHLREAVTETREERDAARRSASAYKGALTKARKRVGKGTCPECNRHFPALREHMTSQHPDLSERTTP